MIQHIVLGILSVLTGIGAYLSARAMSSGKTRYYGQTFGERFWRPGWWPKDCPDPNVLYSSAGIRDYLASQPELLLDIVRTLEVDPGVVKGTEIKPVELLPDYPQSDAEPIKSHPSSTTEMMTQAPDPRSEAQSARRALYRILFEHYASRYNTRFRCSIEPSVSRMRARWDTPAGVPCVRPVLGRGPGPKRTSELTLIPDTENPGTKLVRENMEKRLKALEERVPTRNERKSTLQASRWLQ